MQEIHVFLSSWQFNCPRLSQALLALNPEPGGHGQWSLELSRYAGLKRQKAWHVPPIKLLAPRDQCRQCYCTCKNKSTKPITNIKTHSCLFQLGIKLVKLVSCTFFVVSILISLDYVPVVTIYSCFLLQKYCWIWELRDQSWDGWHRHMRTEWVFIPQQAFLRLQVHGSKLPFASQNNKHTNFSSRIWITEGLSFYHSLCSFSPLKKLSGRGGMSGS